MGGKRRTQESFLAELEQKFPGVYNTSKVKYVNTETPVELICTARGHELKLTAEGIFGKRSYGCKACKMQSVWEAKKVSTDTMAGRFLEAHGTQYGYDWSTYKSPQDEVKITCPVHGEFWQVAAVHAKGCHCPKCSTKERSEASIPTYGKFIQELHEVHGKDKFTPEEGTYSKYTSSMNLLCNQCNTIFSIQPTVLLSSERKGCPDCNRERGWVEMKVTQEEVLERFARQHGDTYDYDMTGYETLDSPIKVYCKVDKEWFIQQAKVHAKGHGCPKCGGRASSTARTESKEGAEIRSKAIHGDKYEYLEKIGTGPYAKWNLICEVHGPFTQRVQDHLRGAGCSKCPHPISKGEKELTDFLSGLGIAVRPQFNTPSGRSVDIYLPESNLAIEFNGLFYHSNGIGKLGSTMGRRASPSWHLQKTLDCLKDGIRLIHIYEDEWMFHREKVINLITGVLGETSEKIGARKCYVKPLSWGEASPFIEKYHLQGAGSPCKWIKGLFFGDTLVGVMAFKSQGEGAVELVRFVTTGRVQGGFSKLLSAFRRDPDFQFTKIISFSDTRWSQGDVYEKNGFHLECEIRPDYYYVRGRRRFHKQGFRREDLEKMLENYNSELSEVENCYNHNIFQIWDCGKKKWVLDLV